METSEVRLVVNGVEHAVPLEPERDLLSVLRDELGLTGSKYGCGEGACGACMVLIDGAAQPACQLSLQAAAGHTVTTIEGLGSEEALHPVQRAFLEQGALQCGYCTPGMIVSAVALLAGTTNPTEREIRTGLQRNLCRCGGYARIVRAVQRAAEHQLGSEGTQR